VSSAMTGMLNGANPLFTAAIGTWMTRRVPPLSLIIGIAVGLAGTVLVAAPALGRGGSSVHGILLIVAALISSGFALNLAGGLQSRYGASAVTWRAQAVALIVTTPLAIGDLMTAHWTATSVLALSALGTLGTGIAYLALAAAARRVGPTRASGTTYRWRSTWSCNPQQARGCPVGYRERNLHCGRGAHAGTNRNRSQAITRPLIVTSESNTRRRRSAFRL